MNLFPTLKIEYKSALTAAEVINWIKNPIKPNNIVGLTAHHENNISNVII